MNLFPTRLRAVLAVAVAAVPLAVTVPSMAAVQAATEPRNCAWALELDPNGVNALFPDQAARYWMLDLPAAPGTSLTINGQFPHARYTSFTSYDSALRSADGLADVAIAPDLVSTNPFRAGASRDARRRSYTVHVVQGAPPAKRAANTLYTSSADGSRTGTTFLVALRIYESDRGLDETGGAALPTVSVHSPMGAATLPGCAMPAAPSTTNELLAQQSAPYRAQAPSAGQIV
jgi:hypothetical protein